MPKVYFTARAIDSFKSETQQVDYRDTHLTGLEMRISPGGTKTFNFVYRFAGNQRRLKIGRYPDLSLADARKRAMEFRGQLAKGIDPAAARDAARDGETFDELARVYIEKYARPNKKTWREDERMIAKDFLPHWKNRRLITITPKEVRKQLERIATRGPRGVIANHCLSLVRKMFDFAVEQEMLEFNPCARIRRLVKPQVRDRVLSFDEIKTLWQALDSAKPLHSRVFRVQLLTGQRIGEVMSMKWCDVEVSTGWWTIPAAKAKNKRLHKVPLSPQVIEILEAQKSLVTSQFVFPAPLNSDRHVLLPTIQRTVMTLKDTVNFSSHVLRHTVATYLASNGASRVVLKRILNHRDGDITARYDHYQYDQEAKTAIENWGRQISSLINGIEVPAKVVAFAGRG